MTTEEQYAKVSAICGDILPYSGTYLETRVNAIQTGEITNDRFTQEMRKVDDIFAQAIAELKTIRFPRMGQRAAHAKLISALTSYRHGIAASIKGATTGDVKAWLAAGRYYTRATAAGADYFDRVYKDRMKGGGAIVL